MELNEHLIKLKSYDVALSIVDDTVIVSVKYPKDWSALKPINKDVSMKTEGGKYYYWASFNLSTDKLFETIYDTIEYNKEVEEKSLLFKEKVNELQQIFLNEDYATLKTIAFKIKKKRGPHKKLVNDGITDEVPMQVNACAVPQETHEQEETNLDKKVEEAISEKSE